MKIIWSLKQFLAITSCALTFFGNQTNVSIAISDSNDSEVTIFHTNDVHGQFKSVMDNENNLKQIGLDFVRGAKESTPNSLLVDAGDAVQGSDLCSLNQDGVTSILNEAKYDVRIPGNHDFDFGYKQVIENAKNSSCPVLAANVVHKNTDVPIFDKINSQNGENCIINVNGKKIGFFGLVTTETPIITLSDNVKDIVFKDEISVAKKQVEKLKNKKVDAIIAITHMGVNSSSEFPTSEILAKQVPGIDVIIDGHSHTKISERINDTLIAQTGAQSFNLGEIKIKFSSNGKLSTSSSIMTAEEVGKKFVSNKKVLNTYNKCFDKIKSIVREVKGYTNTPLYGGTYNNCNIARIGETNLGDMMCDAILKYAEDNFKDYNDLPRVAFINGGGIRSTIDRGFISYGDILKSVIHGNKVAFQIITPKILYSVLERGVGKLNTTDGETFTGVFGGFPQVSGLKFDFDISKDAYDYKTNAGGNRVVSVSLADLKGNTYKSLSRDDNETKLILVTNNSLIHEFPAIADVEIIKVGDNLTDVLANYIKQISLEQGTINYSVHGNRINLVNKQKYKKFDSCILIKDSFGELRDSEVNVRIDDGFYKKYKTDKDGKIYINDLETGFHFIEIENESDLKGEVLVSNLSDIKNNSVTLKDKQSNDFHSVENIIFQIPREVSNDDKNLVKFARTAYNLLSDSSKKKVINYAKLEDAEKALFGTCNSLIENNKSFFTILSVFLISLISLIIMFYRRINKNKEVL